MIIGDGFERLGELFRTMENGRFEVLFALGGSAGLRAARLERPQAILCEIGLRDMSSLELCRTIRGNPMLASTSFSFIAKSFHNRQNIAEAISAGADDFLSEHSEPEHLIARIYLTMARRRHDNLLHEQYEILRSRQAQIADIAKIAARVSNGRYFSTGTEELRTNLLEIDEASPHSSDFIPAGVIASLANLLDEQVRALDEWKHSFQTARPVAPGLTNHRQIPIEPEFVM